MPLRLRTLLSILAVIPLALFMAACPTRAPEPDLPVRPKIERSSPESALRAYWSLIDWYHLRNAPDARRPPPPLGELMAEVAAGEALASFDRYTPQRNRYERTIERVESAGEDRADVYTRFRNLTNNPVPITPTPVELFERETAGSLRYAMVREPGGWKVAEVWRLDEAGGPRRLR